MGQVSVGVPPSGLASPLRQTAADLGLRRIHLRLGRVTVNGGSAQARYTATADLASGHTWTYPAGFSWLPGTGTGGWTGARPPSIPG